MPLLFSYGTLQDEAVQNDLFGRPLAGRPDALPGYELSSVSIDDPELVKEYGRTHNANVVFNGRPDSRVNGTVYEITEAGLLATDAYENPDDYDRFVLRLASGREAWVYRHVPRTPPL